MSVKTRLTVPSWMGTSSECGASIVATSCSSAPVSSTPTQSTFSTPSELCICTILHMPASRTSTKVMRVSVTSASPHFHIACTAAHPTSPDSNASMAMMSTVGVGQLATCFGYASTNSDPLHHSLGSEPT
ncbi:MAG: hypothetical protein A2135_09920 [Actinobacteria bacterium RBG_16_67_15]|nr:MAG: hypothetical protein A2135_09920 [Actinobacteria bacterium RBG_16_67_15]